MIPNFLAGGGEMGSFIRAHDWSATPLGPPDAWPQALRTAIRLILNTGHPMYVFWGPEGHCFYNDAYRQSIGPERHPGSLGRPAREVWLEIWPIIGPQIEQVMSGGGATWHENHLVPITRNGRREDVYWTYSYGPIDDEGAPNGVGGVLVVCTETTEQVLAERRLLVERERQRLMLQQMPGFVAVLSGPEHRFEYVNDAYRSIAGERDFLGRTVREVFPDVAGQGIFELLDGVYRSGESFADRALPVRLDQPDGERVVDLLYEPIRDDAGAVTGIFVGGYDVTEQVRSAQRLRESEAQLRGLLDTLEQRVAERTAALEAAHEQLRQIQKLEAMGSLTGGVAHDFNNLLTPIIGALDMLQRRGLGGERERRLIAGAAQSAERARVLVQRLLAFARRQPLQPVPVDVAALVEGMATLIASTAGPQIKVVVDIGPSLPAAKADPNQLEMALLNLAVNARDAMTNGGTLRITASAETIEPGGYGGLRAGRYVRLSVADTGVGMDKATLARAVEPFFSTKGIGKGTGLGLSMVHGLASQLGGELKISSRPGLGTNVELWLPETCEPVHASMAATEATSSAARGTVLIVDDEEFVRLSTGDMLADLGYAVREASSAEQALAMVRNGEKVDLVVTDHLMAGMNGTDLARALQAMLPGIPILIISGYAEIEGVDPDLPRLTKPFRKDELANSIAHLGNGAPND